MPPASKKMRKALDELVIAPLKAQGFEGEYPHFRRVTSEERIELLVIEIGTGRYGNQFGVCGSVIFPKEAEPLRRNYYPPPDELPLDKINVYCTNLRKSLPGNFDGGFYYTDVYAEKVALLPGIPRTSVIYEAVSEKRAATFQPNENQRLLQKYDENTCMMLAEEANRQMPQLLKWLAKMQMPGDLIREQKRNYWRQFKFYRWIEERFNHD